jgi:hypothetical protein
MALLALTACTTTQPTPVQPSLTPTIITSTATTAQSIPQLSTPKAPPPTCPAWNTKLQEDKSTPVQSEIYKVDVSAANACYDRAEFTINGSVRVGFVADWTVGLSADPSGQHIPMDASAILQAVIRAPAQGYDMSGHQPGKQLAAIGDVVGGKGRVIREVKFAGSFESQSTFGIGLDQRRPFRVTTRTQDGYTYVAVDIAVER